MSGRLGSIIVFEPGTSRTSGDAVLSFLRLLAKLSRRRGRAETTKRLADRYVAAAVTREN